MVAAGLRALLAHWWRHKLQLVALVSGLALATALWSGVQAINGQARQSYAEAAAMLGQDRFTRLQRSDLAPVALGDYIALRRAGWLVSPVVEGTWRKGGAGPVRVLGLDPLTAPQGTAPQEVTGAAELSRFLGGEVALGHPDTIAALASVDGLPALEAADGIVPDVLVMDIGVAQRVLAAEGRISYLIVAEVQPMRHVPLVAVAPDLVERGPPAQSDLARLTDSFHLNLTAFGLLSFAVGLFIVHSAIGLAFEQRRPMFRTLRALGMPLRVLMTLLAAEVVLFAFVAGGSGMVAGYGLAALLLPDVAATLRGLYGASVDGTLRLAPSWWIGGLAIAVIGAGAAAAQSLWQLARMPLLAAAQPRAWAQARRRSQIAQSALAGLFAAVAVGMAVFGQGLVSGFVLLGALLLAAALALPSILSVALALAGRFVLRPVAQWFWADTRQQLPSLSLALMALLLALSANVGVGTMVSSFRATFVGWLDQRLASEVYIRAETEAQAADLRAWLAPRVDAVLPIWSVDGTVLGAPVSIYGVVDHPTYRDNWPMLEVATDAWGAVADGQGVLINEQMARRSDLQIGQVIPLPQLGDLEIVGIYTDYGNPTGQAMVSLPVFLSAYPDVPRLRHAVRIAPDKVPDLITDVLTAFDLPPDNVSDQASVKAFSLAVFDRTFTVTGALNVLTLGVAGFALLMGLLTLSSMRMTQLAPVWAMGLTRAQLGRLELVRALMLSAFVMVLAVPVGLILAWALLAVVNVAAFGWRLPMQVFPADWVRLGILALIAGGLAAAWPAWRLARTAPSDLLKVFSNER